MRKSISGIAVIRSERHGVVRWLAQWNDNWNAFNLVGGHKLPGESFRECVIREVREELGLSAGNEFLVSNNALARLSYGAESGSAQEDTLYTMEVFQVELLLNAESKINSDSANRWLTESEIRQQRCEDGTAVSPTMQLLLNHSGHLPAKTAEPPHPLL